MHYTLLRGVAKYLRATKSWGIRYKQDKPLEDLAEGTPHDLKLPEGMDSFPEKLSGGQFKGFVDAAHAKTARYLRSVLHKLGMTQTEPTPIYKDNQSTIKILKNNVPTE